MIELRWLVTKRNDYFKTVESKILQFRILQDTNIYAGLPRPVAAPNMQWSRWMDIPEVVKQQK